MAKTALALLAAVFLANFAWAEDTSQDASFIFQADQSISGNGFHNSFNNIDSGRLVMDGRGYGSGKYLYESMTKVQNDAKYNTTKDQYTKLKEEKIKYDESVDFSYGSMDFALGRTFAATSVDKLGKEEICIKNYGDPVSMKLLFDSASVLSKNLSADLLWKASAYDESQEKWNDEKGHTNLSYDAAFTGRNHLGVLGQHYDGLANAKNRKLDFEIDEDYHGSYHLTNKLSHTFGKADAILVEEWLPCCSGGFADMNPIEARVFKSAKGIFDCTCFVPPDKAEFA